MEMGRDAPGGWEVSSERRAAGRLVDAFENSQQIILSLPSSMSADAQTCTDDAALLAKAVSSQTLLYTLDPPITALIGRLLEVLATGSTLQSGPTRDPISMSVIDGSGQRHFEIEDEDGLC